MQQRYLYVLIAAFLPLTFFNDCAAQTSDVQIIKQRVVNDLLTPTVNETSVRQLVRSLRSDGTWPGINYEDTSRTGFQHKDHLEHMLELAHAFRKPGSPLYHDPEVKTAFSQSLDFWLKHDFRCANWWWNEMGTPNLMISILLVMDSSLTQQQRQEGFAIAHRANLETFGARPGGDFMPIAGMLAKQGLFLADRDTLAKALNAMQRDVKISTGRGLQPDMSFHHRTDNVISTLTYGTNYATAFAYWAAKTAHTPYTFSDQLVQLIVNYFLDGICQSLVYRAWPDPGAMNRDISRQNALSVEGTGLPRDLLAATTYRSEELQQVIDIRTGKLKPDLTRDRYFWYSHYYTHQRPRYFVSVRMHSKRANNMEEPHNEEGVQNHHYGDGSMFISRTAHEFFNIFPVWDWQKIPGTTILQRASLPHWRELAKKGKTTFAGGVSDGTYGVAAFDFASVHDPLTAHKSWFFFDDEVVCLGSAIHADSASSVFTTLNQCLLHGPVITGNGNKTTTLRTGKHSSAGVSWVYHDSVAYIFPQPTAINISNEQATGSWHEINHQSWATTATVQKDVFTLWIDHGVRPQQASYAWIVLPNADPAATAAYSRHMPVTILSNTGDIQAVQHQGLQRTGVVFYKAGAIRINDKLTLAASKPCIVMIKAKEDDISAITVADPAQQLDSLQLKVNERIIDVQLPTGDKAGSTVALTLPVR